jgi:hypothetical protein
MTIPEEAIGDGQEDDREAEEADLELLAAKPPGFPRCRHKKQAPCTLLCFVVVCSLRRSTRGSTLPLLH